METNLSPDIIKQKMLVALQKANISFQRIQDEINHLDFNEDTVQMQLNVLKGIREVEKQAELVHKMGKAEALRVCKLWDDGLKSIKQMTQGLTEQVQPKYQALCVSIKQKEEAERKEKERVTRIKNTMDSVLFEFGQQIQSCSSRNDLVVIQRSINLTRTAKGTYDDFLPQMIERLDGLNDAINEAKNRIDRMEKLEKDKKRADAETLMEIEAEQYQLEQELKEKKLLMQEELVNDAENESKPIEVDVELPKVKARYTSVEFEIFDMNETEKKEKEWVIKTVDNTKVSEFLKKNKEKILTDGELIHAGIRFYKHERF